MRKQFDPHEADDRARLMIAVVISLAIFLGFYFFVEKPKMEERRVIAEKALRDADSKAAVAKVEDVDLSRTEVLEHSGERIQIRGARVFGSLALKGARLDDLSLEDHYQTLAREEKVALLTPTGTQHSFYVEHGWLATRSGVDLPDANTVWALAPESAREITSGGQPVVLTWNNGAGLSFRRSFQLDENFLFTVSQSVTNNTGSAIDLNPYEMVARHGKAVDYTGMFVLHEGPVGVMGKEGIEPSYKDLEKGEKIEYENTSGWLALTDKYWMVALLPQPDARFNARMIGTRAGNDKFIYQSDIVGERRSIAAGETAEITSYVYAGVKSLPVIKNYEDTYHFRNLEYGIDFGMWHLLTKPLFMLLHWLGDVSGSIAAAILLLTVVVRLCLFPLTNKSFRSMAKMRVLAPQMKELQEQYKSDRAGLQMAIMELYKKEDVNPLSGCWPMLLQIPIMFSLYKVILISVELRHAPFWGWVQDMSAPDPTTIFNLFGLIDWDPPRVLMFGAWPLLFLLSMVQLQRISPPITDPMQERLHAWMPYIFSVLLAHFAAGLVIYWTWSNCLTILQQFYILKKVGKEDTSLLRGHSGRRKKKAAPKGAADVIDAEAVEIDAGTPGEKKPKGKGRGKGKGKGK
ncbi:MAG: membrane protein insertase YidC [Bdellovibrionales bacterium]|jgi:YidC/Oxa1 family membrane protein insertase|nr:membrane protein insertase YidC [Bdellovibrionales bacterium]